MQDFSRHPALQRAALVTASSVTATFGVYFLDQGDDLNIASFVSALVPLKVWAWVWIGVAAVMLAGVLSRTLSRWSLSIGASLWTVWGMSFIVEWATNDGGYLIGFALLGFGAFMWIVAALIEGNPEMAELVVVDPQAGVDQ